MLAKWQGRSSTTTPQKDGGNCEWKYWQVWDCIGCHRERSIIGDRKGKIANYGITSVLETRALTVRIKSHRNIFTFFWEVPPVTAQTREKGREKEGKCCLCLWWAWKLFLSFFAFSLPNRSRHNALVACFIVQLWDATEYYGDRLSKCYLHFTNWFMRWPSPNANLLIGQLFTGFLQGISRFIAFFSHDQ